MSARFSSVLVANRGEIACRIIRAARDEGLRVVAVYSDADAEALHVRLADAAVRIGPAAAAQSYLSIDALIAAAKAAGAEAVHPGYGFLAESADFAERCAAAGLVFVGPPPAAMRAMGDKSKAKARMTEAGVPCAPGYHGEVPTRREPALTAPLTRSQRSCHHRGLPEDRGAGGGRPGDRAACQMLTAVAIMVHPTNACFISWRLRIFSLKNSWSRKP